MGLQARNPYENDERFGEIEAASDADEEVLPVVELRSVHHIAIAVADLDEALAEHRDAFGVVVDSREIVADEAVEVAVLTIGTTRLHLMAPTDDDSWLVEFLDDQASGLCHVGYLVDDCAAAMAALADHGYELVDDEPKAGPEGTRTAYLHPPDQPGTLIQLVED